VAEIRPLVRYGKPSAELIAIKQSFFRENAQHLAHSRTIGAVYRRQPARTKCKCCDGALDGIGFTKQDIDYVLCARCGHVNGRHEDTAEFCRSVYTDEDGKDYAANYAAEDRAAFDRRIEVIYLPKARFLIDGLHNAGETPEALAYADIGAGSGYFVGAMRAAGLGRAVGYEVSAAQCALAHRMAGQGSVQQLDLDGEAALVARLDAEVVSLIGVLEHVRHPRALLAALRDNPKIRYLYLSVPLFSPSVYFEMVFPEAMQRQLSGGHTHLYTESSLDWTCREYGFGRVAEWWFGTDLVDLYRSVLVGLEADPALRAMAEPWSRSWAGAIDEMQHALDSRKLSSEVHLLLSV
jgi:hypothetical protein